MNKTRNIYEFNPICIWFNHLFPNGDLITLLIITSLCMRQELIESITTRRTEPMSMSILFIKLYINYENDYVLYVHKYIGNIL